MARLAGLIKPEYCWQPKFLLGRISPFRSPATAEFIHRQLPWGPWIRVRPSEEHGRALSTLGIIDLSVTEALWRLTDPGEVTIDVGANVGYMTSILANRVNDGSVWCFEANPEVFEELKFNVAKWRTVSSCTSFHMIQAAVSARRGILKLQVPDAFITNRGLSFVSDEQGMASAPEVGASGQSFSVESISLDEIFSHVAQIGVTKIDVEGHESMVLLGAQRLLRERRMRDIIFEEHRPYPTDACRLLEQAGYRIFRINRNFWGPLLLSPDSSIPRSGWQPTSFLATVEEARAVKRLHKRGWHALKRRKQPDPQPCKQVPSAQ